MSSRVPVFNNSALGVAPIPPMRSAFESARIEKAQSFAQNDPRIDNEHNPQDAFGFGIKGQELRYSGLASGFNTDEDEIEKEKLLRRSQIASAISRDIGNQLISQIEFDQIKDFTSQRIEELDGEINRIDRQIADTKQQIEDTKLERVQTQSEKTLNARDLMRSAEFQSRAENTELDNAQSLEKMQKELEAAKASGDASKVAELTDKMKITESKQAEVKLQVDELKKDTEASSERHSRSNNRLERLDKKLDNLENDLKKLNGTRTDLVNEYNEYNKFQDYLNDPATKQKLAEGKLTIQDLKDNHAPQGVIDELTQNGNSSPTLTAKQVIKAQSHGIKDLKSDVKDALQNQFNNSQVASASSKDGNGITADHNLKSSFKAAAVGEQYSNAVNDPQYEVPKAAPIVAQTGPSFGTAFS